MGPWVPSGRSMPQELWALGELVDKAQAPAVFQVFSGNSKSRNPLFANLGSLETRGDPSSATLLCLSAIPESQLGGTVITAGLPGSKLPACFQVTTPPSPTGVSGQRRQLSTCLPSLPYSSFLSSKALLLRVKRTIFSFPSSTSFSPSPQDDLYVPFSEARIAKENWKTKKGNPLGDIF